MEATSSKYATIMGILLMVVSTSCGGNDQRIAALNERVDSLETAVGHAYGPGLGEFMSAIQVHHVKLWSAGTHANWKLADFEVHEIMETLDDIKTYASDRKETAMIEMINPALDSVNVAIAKADTARFRSAYLSLTNSCNNCHRATEHGFNVITVPTSPPFSDQRFAPLE